MITVLFRHMIAIEKIVLQGKLQIAAKIIQIFYASILKTLIQKLNAIMT